MNLALKSADDTRSRIIDAAEDLFQTYGYGKTTVADIAKACGMSPANVYRFFENKAEIVGAIARIWLGEMEEEARRVAVQNRPAAERLKEFILHIHNLTVNRYMTSTKVHEMVHMVITEQWPICFEHIGKMRGIIAVILAAGVETGEFDIDDVEEAAETVKNAIVKFHHPSIVAQCQHEPLAEQAGQVADLLLKGLRKQGG